MLQASDSDSILNSAIAHHEAGRIDLAEAGYQAVLEDDPNQPDALNLLGLLVQNKGNYAESIALIERALEIDPDFPEALSNLARAKRAAGDARAAAELAERATHLDPALAEAHFQHGRALLDLMRPEAAVAPLLRAVQLDPTLLDARICLGNARMRMRDFTEAVVLFEGALAIDPDRVEALVNIGASLLALDRAPLALAHQRHAVDVAPNDPMAHAGVASALSRLGDIRASVDACIRAVTLAPDYHDAWILLGTNYTSLGSFDEAEAAFRKALALSPESGGARAGLAAIGRGSADNSEIQHLISRMHDTDASDYERSSAGFALGSLLDGEGRYDEAFQAYAAANEHVRATRLAQGRAFDLTALQQHVVWAKAVCDPVLFEATKGWGNASEKPVFIVGMPRSGTTLVEQIAAKHSLVHGAGELKAIPALIAALDGGPAQQSPLRWDRDRITELTVAHLKMLTSLDANAARVIDKLPDNIQALGQIAVLFPNARIIFCRRDPRDVCLSCYFQYFRDGSDWSFDLARCAARARQIEELTDHWRSVLPGQMLEISYETLVEDLEKESRRLIAFLGLDWDPACLDFHKSDRPVLTASHWQVRQPLYSTSIGRWRNYQAHLQPMLEGLGPLANQEQSGQNRSPRSAGVRSVAGADSPAALAADRLAALARAHLIAKAPGKAMQAAEQAVAAGPDSASGYVMLGLSLIELGRPADAIAPLRTAVRLGPERVEAWINLASALSRTADYAAAEEPWRRALAFDADNVDCLTSLAIVLAELGRHADSIGPQRRAAELRPDDAIIHHNLASALLGAQQVDAAIAAARRAVSLRPEEPTHQMRLAECLSALGRFDEAESYFHSALSYAPDSSRALAGLVNIGRSLSGEREISRLRDILTNTSMTASDRSNAGFAVARLLDKTADYDRAFEACEAANRIVASCHKEIGRTYDLDQFSRYVDSLLAWFTPAMAGNVKGGDPSELPVFIVGMPRSGTTLVDQIITGHPKAFGLGETHVVETAVHQLDSEATRLGRRQWSAKEITAKARAFVAAMRADAGDAVRVTEKLPGNLQFIGHLGMLLPRARVILCRRDLRDVGLSCFFENFADGLEWSFDLSTIASYAYQMERLAVHWRHVRPLRMLEIQYEDLVGNLEGKSRELIDFLGLDWDPNCLDFHNNKRQVMTASHWQVRQPLYSSSVGRWRNYQRHLGPLIEGLKGIVPAD